MKVLWYILAQCAALGIAVRVGDPPPVPSNKFGITGEPTKVDTAFGNLGELGPVYNTPEAQNNSTATISGNLQFSAAGNRITKTTEPPKTVGSTTVAQNGKLNSSNVEGLPTVETTDGEKVKTGSVLNGTTNEEKLSEFNTNSNPTQTFETTTVPIEQPTAESNMEGGNNMTTNFQNVSSVITQVTNGPGVSAISITSSPVPKNASSSAPSSIPPSTLSSTPSTTEGSMQQTTPVEPPSQIFHTGSPNSTDSSTIAPGPNATTPAQNTSTTSKPNSSLTLYPNSVNIWVTLAVILYLHYESQV